MVPHVTYFVVFGALFRCVLLIDVFLEKCISKSFKSCNEWMEGRTNRLMERNTDKHILLRGVRMHLKSLWFWPNWLSMTNTNGFPWSEIVWHVPLTKISSSRTMLWPRLNPLLYRISFYIPHLTSSSPNYAFKRQSLSAFSALRLHQQPITTFGLRQQPIRIRLCHPHYTQA